MIVETDVYFGLGGVVLGGFIQGLIDRGRIQHLERENEILFGNLTKTLRKRYESATETGPKRDRNGRFTR